MQNYIPYKSKNEYRYIKEDYFNKAISLANDIEKLTLIRKNLREKARNSPLFDRQTFGNDFSELVKDMWAIYASNKNNK